MININEILKKLPVMLVAFGMVMASSCKKDKPADDRDPIIKPGMEYIDLKNKEIRANNPAYFLDVNRDGRKDILFSTLLVGDPIRMADKLQYIVTSDIETNLPVNEHEQVPVMAADELIPVGNFNGFNWFGLTSIIMVQKVTTFTDVLWEGKWTGAVNRYLPFQLKKNDRLYNGWVQLSVDIPGEKIILHKAAISTIAEKSVNAGH